MEEEIDKLYKDHFGKMVAALLYSSRDINPEMAEDIVQDSFSAALTDWRAQGLPLNPTGWIYKVCRNKALNRIRKEKRVEGLSDNVVAESVEIKFSESVLDDQQLKLLFACAHPDLSPKVQVVITLKYVANLKVEAIAKILGMTIDGIDKMLLRARQRIKDEKILLEEPHPSAWAPRLPSVHKVLYLIFNEGYKSSWGKEILREELCEEALLMTKALIDSPLANKDTAALYSLMLFNGARFKSRFGANGELLDLETQDRSTWNYDLIALARSVHHKSQTDTISSYHLESSIAYLHCTASSFDATNWTLISQLYSQLLHLRPNPFVELNFAIALYYSGEKEKALGKLHNLERQTFLNQYYLLNTTLGKFHTEQGDHSLAKAYLEKAQHQTNFDEEKKFIRKMLDRLP